MDKNINNRNAVITKLKPGEKNKRQPYPYKCSMVDTAVINLFDGVTKPVITVAELPVIVIETFRDKFGTIVPGIGKMEKYTMPGETYMSHDSFTHKQLTDVTICSTTAAYFYIFSGAEKKPHFVMSKSLSLDYHSKLIKHSISTRCWFGRSLDKPIKLLSDHSITQGLRSGNLEESAFYFFSNRTDEFKAIFSFDNIKFNIDYFMIIFDQQQNNGKCSDFLKRGFTTHLDLGWSREGASSTTEKSQQENGETVNAKPVIMGLEDHFVNLGNLPDLVMEMTDGIVFDNENILMPDKHRDKEFAALLRQKMKASTARFEAYTIVRQHVCVIGRENSSSFQGTARHIDGPNDTRIGYRHTCVFSFLCQWNDVSSNWVMFLDSFLFDVPRFLPVVLRHYC